MRVEMGKLKEGREEKGEDTAAEDEEEEWEDLRLFGLIKWLYGHNQNAPH